MGELNSSKNCLECKFFKKIRYKGFPGITCEKFNNYMENENNIDLLTLMKKIPEDFKNKNICEWFTRK